MFLLELLEKKEKPRQGGDCFLVAGKAILYSGLEPMRLVHAFVNGTGMLKGKRFEHAWDEIGDVVIDKSNGNNIVMRKEQYYKLAGVQQTPGQYAIYGKAEAVTKMAKSGHWGPWDLTERSDGSAPLSEMRVPIDEVLDQPYPVQQIIHTVDSQAFAFTTESGVKYTIRIVKEFSDSNEWEFAFVANIPATRPGGGSRGYTYKRTDTGDQFKVFATVLQVIKAFLLEIKPDALEWDADKEETNRSKLYLMMLKRYAPELEKMGYQAQTGNQGLPSAFVAKYENFKLVKKGAVLKKHDMTEEISQDTLDQVELFADRLWHSLGIDVQFTRHFLQRVNDPRNGEPITAAELVRLFKKEYELHGREIAHKLRDRDEAVMRDLVTSVNLPFVKSEYSDSKKLVAKSIMRKPNFKSHDRFFNVSESVHWKTWRNMYEQWLDEGAYYGFSIYGRTPPKKMLARITDNEGYSLEIFGGVRSPDNSFNRTGIEHYVTPDGRRVRGGFWMAFPEESWQLTPAQWLNMPWEARAKLEAEEQLKHAGNKYSSFKQAFENFSKTNRVMRTLKNEGE